MIPTATGGSSRSRAPTCPRNIIQISNVVAAGLTQSVGYAMACKMRGEETVALVYFGDGASSQGETHEAMNFASVHKLPVVFICENNRYAISVPQRKQMGVEEIASRARRLRLPWLHHRRDGLHCLLRGPPARPSPTPAARGRCCWKCRLSGLCRIPPTTTTGATGLPTRWSRPGSGTRWLRWANCCWSRE